jgi:hypothetical protein
VKSSASYAKQAGDDVLARYSLQIKNRAIRRAGEILQEVKPAPGKRTDKPNLAKQARSSRKEAATDAGLSEHQKKQALQIANIPEKEFICSACR